MRRRVIDGRVFYRVDRIRWDLIAHAIAVRLGVAIIGAVIGTIAIGQGWVLL